MKRAFETFATRATCLAGSPWAFGAALTTVLAWAALGPQFGWSDTHSLTINTITTIVTFLVVFLIQHTQNREAQATQAKLDEVLKALNGAHKQLIRVEERTEQEIEELRP